MIGVRRPCAPSVRRSWPGNSRCSRHPPKRWRCFRRRRVRGSSLPASSADMLPFQNGGAQAFGALFSRESKTASCFGVFALALEEVGLVDGGHHTDGALGIGGGDGGIRVGGFPYCSRPRAVVAISSWTPDFMALGAAGRNVSSAAMRSGPCVLTRMRPSSRWASRSTRV